MTSVKVVDFTNSALGVIRLEKDDVTLSYVMELNATLHTAFVTECKFRNTMWIITVRHARSVKSVLENAGYEDCVCHYDGE